MEEDIQLFDITTRTDLVVSLSNFVTHGRKFDALLVETRIWAETDKYIFPQSLRADTRAMDRKVEHSACVKWISAAGRHVLNAHIHEALPEAVQTRARALRARCCQWMYPGSNKPFLRKEDLDWAISEAERLLQLLDRHYGIELHRKRRLGGL